MFKLGLKLWSVNENYFKEAVRLYKEGYYDYIELYVIPGSFENFINLWKTIEIPFIIHAPHFRHGLNLAKEDVFEQNLKFAAETRKFADKLNAEYIIFHPGIAGKVEETVRQINIINDSRILIENKPYYTVLGDGNICNGHSPEEIKYIAENTNTGFCLDIGHCFCSANAKKINAFKYLRDFLVLKPQMYHLTDNDFSSDIDNHLHFGEGDFNVAKVLNHIPEGAKITLETNKNSKENLDDFIKDVENIRHFDFEILKATEADMLDVFYLSNDPVVRGNSFNSAEIEIEEHKKWFLNKINDKNCFFYIIRNKLTQKLISYIRYEKKEDDEFTVSIAITPEFRGKNYGAKLLKMLSSNFVNKNQNNKVKAYIKPENINSINTFKKAGFNLAQKNPENVLLEYN